MAWITKWKPGEEIVIDDRTVMRLDSDRPVQIWIDSIGVPPRHKIIKRQIGAADE